ncbi:MAG: Fe-S-containing protein [Bacteroidota bacterium]
MNHCTQCGSEIPGGAKFCPSCGAAVRGTGAPVPQPSKRTPGTRKRWIIRGAMIAILIAGIGVFLNQLLRTYHPTIDGQPVVAMVSMYGGEQISSVPVTSVMSRGSITVPLKLVLEHKLVRFSDPEGIQETPMIAYITPQGKLVTAMSRSEHCGSTDFYLKGNNIHCAQCPSYWNMASLEAYACCQKYYPDPFPSSVTGDEVRIDPTIIRAWRSRL